MFVAPPSSAARRMLVMALPPLQAQLPMVSDRLDDLGVFHWYSYTQDFDPDFVSSWIDRICPDATTICDPFLGSGTTLVVAQLRGLIGIGNELSPFMRLVCRAKTRWNLDLDVIADMAEWAVDLEVTDAERDRLNAIYEGDKLLLKWIEPEPALQVLALEERVRQIDDVGVREFLQLAVARDLLAVSNMTLRPNICYKGKRELARRRPVREMFTLSVSEMLTDLGQVQAQATASEPGAIAIHGEDARSFAPDPGSVDVVVTSPPYPNDMEYVHQTRLELAFLRFAQGKRELGALKRQMISSSVKLVYRENEYQGRLICDSPLAVDVVAQLEAARNKSWGWNAAAMAAHYFGGMRLMMRQALEALRPGGHLLLVVGDSSFNGVMLPTDRILEQIGELDGFVSEGIETFRPRFNTKHDANLAEMVVVLRKPLASPRQVHR
jgi:hypothetical protein